MRRASVGAWCCRAFITVMEEKWREREGEREWERERERERDNFMEIYVARVKGSQRGSQNINVPLSFFGDEHLIFYRLNQTVFRQWSVSVPLAPVTVFPLTGFISFPDKWHQMRGQKKKKKERKKKKKNFSHTLGSDELMLLPTSTCSFLSGWRHKVRIICPLALQARIIWHMWNVRE